MAAIILAFVAFVIVNIVNSGWIGVLIAFAIFVMIISLSGGDDDKYG